MRHAAAARMVLMLAGFALLLGACGRTDSGGALEGSPPGAPPAATTGTVAVDLAEWSVAPVPDRARAGQVTFEIANAGTMAHELLVIATTLAPDALPMDQGSVDEDAVDVRGEIEPFAAGEDRNGTFTLQAGPHVLICNVPGHYRQGMRAALTVVA